MQGYCSTCGYQETPQLRVTHTGTFNYNSVTCTARPVPYLIQYFYSAFSTPYLLFYSTIFHTIFLMQQQLLLLKLVDMWFSLQQAPATWQN